MVSRLAASGIIAAAVLTLAACVVPGPPDDVVAGPGQGEPVPTEVRQGDDDDAQPVGAEPQILIGETEVQGNPTESMRCVLDGDEAAVTSADDPLGYIFGRFTAEASDWTARDFELTIGGDIFVQQDPVSATFADGIFDVTMPMSTSMGTTDVTVVVACA